jgi:hypothetical protein
VFCSLTITIVPPRPHAAETDRRTTSPVVIVEEFLPAFSPNVTAPEALQYQAEGSSTRRSLGDDFWLSFAHCFEVSNPVRR